MPEVELTEEEQADIQEYLRNARGLAEQISTLAIQRARLIKAANTAWRSAYRGAMLEDKLSKECDVPELIGQSDEVNIRIGWRTASWAESAEDKTD